MEKQRNRSTVECELIFLPTPIHGAQSIGFLVLRYTINTYNGPSHENEHKRIVQPATSSELWNYKSHQPQAIWLIFIISEMSDFSAELHVSYNHHEKLVNEQRQTKCWWRIIPEKVRLASAKRHRWIIFKQGSSADVLRSDPVSRSSEDNGRLWNPQNFSKGTGNTEAKFLL